MKNNYCVKEAFKDIFGTWVLENQRFDGFFDMPVIGNHDDITSIDYLALYSDQSEYCKTENTAVCFYEYDHIFDGIHGLYNSIIYENEAKLVKFRERFAHAKWIIAPDYSLFGDFPNALQINNVYRSRFCAVWLKNNTSAKIIPNVRWSESFSYNYSFDGIEKGSNVSVGFMGLQRKKENLRMFMDGFEKMIDTIMPKSILIYGFVNESNANTLFAHAIERGVKIVIPHAKIDRYKKEGAIYGVR